MEFLGYFWPFIKSIDHLYKESRALTLSNVRFFSDGRVRHALDSKEEREGKWSQKFSSAIFVKGLVEEVVAPLPIQEPVLTVGQSLDDSLASSFSEEVVVPPQGPTASLTKKGLKEKIQAGVQGRVNEGKSWALFNAR